jgi:hypothetical protein
MAYETAFEIDNMAIMLKTALKWGIKLSIKSFLGRYCDGMYPPAVENTHNMVMNKFFHYFTLANIKLKPGEIDPPIS